MDNPPATPRLVTFLGYLALACLVLLPIAVLTVRAGQWQSGLGLYALAALVSLVVLVVSIIMLLLPRYASWRAAIGRTGLIALPGAFLILSMVGGRGSVPPIHDITTDTEDPPTFITAAQVRGSQTNPLTIKPDFIEQQRAAYADLAPLRTSLSEDQAFTRALTTARELGWEVYHEDRTAGVIEAVDTTRIMAFKDDIVIRVRTDAAGTKVDLRSVSRVGLGDLGANAERIRAFAQAFTQQ